MRFIIKLKQAIFTLAGFTSRGLNLCTVYVRAAIRKCHEPMMVVGWNLS